MESRIDITKHPYDPASILNWALDIWEKNPEQGLIIITTKGDGADLDNRIRVKLSIARGQIKAQLGTDSKRFTILSQVIPWAHDAQATQPCEALYLKYVVRSSHVARDAFDKIFLEKSK